MQRLEALTSRQARIISRPGEAASAEGVEFNTFAHSHAFAQLWRITLDDLDGICLIYVNFDGHCVVIVVVATLHVAVCHPQQLGAGIRVALDHGFELALVVALVVEHAIELTAAIGRKVDGRVELRD